MSKVILILLFYIVHPYEMYHIPFNYMANCEIARDYITTTVRPGANVLAMCIDDRVKVI